MNPITWLTDNLPEMDAEKRKVIEFIFLWQEYNYKYCILVPGLGDYSGALALASCPNAQRVYENLKHDFLNYFRNIPSNVPGNSPRVKLCADYVHEREVKYHADGKDSLEDFLKVVYQIRCNFLHGGKMREYVENDIKLIGWAKDSLGKFLHDINYFG